MQVPGLCQPCTHVNSEVASLKNVDRLISDNEELEGRDLRVFMLLRPLRVPVRGETTA